MRKLFVTLIVAAATAALFAAAADAKPQKQRRVQTHPPTQIACTELGCHPVPPGCTPRAGRTWSGMPSGFDVVVCPGGRTFGRWY
jgi:hypothetical protein